MRPAASERPGLTSRKQRDRLQQATSSNQQILDITIFALSELLTKYFQLIDDKDFAAEKLLAIFTEHGTVTRPNDSVVSGPAEIAESNKKSFSRFRATQHLPSGYLVEIAGDEATIRANVMAMHLWADGYGDPNALERHFVAKRRALDALEVMRGRVLPETGALPINDFTRQPCSSACRRNLRRRTSLLLQRPHEPMHSGQDFGFAGQEHVVARTR